MPSSNFKTDFDRDGFVIVRNYLPAKELSDLQQHLDRYLRDIVRTLPPSDAFYEDRNRPETLKQLQRMDCDPFFDEYKQNRRWSSLAEELLGEPATADPPEWFNKPPGTNHVTPPHQDNYYFCLTPPSVLTIWLALDSVDAENGCLRYAAGSHLAGFRPHAKSKILGFSQGITNFTADDFASERAILLAPGDAVAHHGMTIHRADANHSATRHRRSFAMVFKGVSAHRDQETYQRYLTSAREQQQELVPGSGPPK
jgi:phytanoyl-CoA hydroxylase